MMQTPNKSPDLISFNGNISISGLRSFARNNIVKKRNKNINTNESFAIFSPSSLIF